MNQEATVGSPNPRTNCAKRIDELHTVFLNHFSHQVELSIQALKVAMLLNGGASVALLAFLGQLFARGTGLSPHELNLIDCLTTFLMGTFLGGASSYYAFRASHHFTRRARENYLSFLRLNTDRDDIRDPELPLSQEVTLEDATQKSSNRMERARKNLRFSSLSVCLSFLIFLAGVAQAYWAMHS